MSTPIHTTPRTVSVTTQKLDTEAEYQALIDGINAMLPGVDPFDLAGQSIPRAQLLAAFESRVDAARSTKAQRLALLAAIAHEKEVNSRTKPLRAAFKTYAQGRYGKSASELQKFGLVPNRTPKKTATKKAAAVAKGQATRKARGIQGRQQRAAITAGAPAASATPSPTPLPAPAAPPTSPPTASPAAAATPHAS
jgi:hypothetical protein